MAGIKGRGAGSAVWWITATAALLSVGWAGYSATVLSQPSAAAATWTIQPTPNPPGASSSYLTGVSCPRPVVCTAVGYATTGGVSGGTITTLAERYQDGTWTIQPTPNPPGASASYLTGVSCPTQLTCTAVGYSITGGASGGTTTTLAERYQDGTWTIQPTPNPPGASSSYLSGVSCASSMVCTAVGQAVIGGTTTTLAERYQVGVWTIESTPAPPGSSSSSLAGVSCASSMVCTAVGQAVIGGTTTTLAERYQDGVWTIESTPSPPPSSRALAGVSCPTIPVCTAVGYTAGGGAQGTLALRRS